VALLPAFKTRFVLYDWLNALTQHKEVGLVRRETQHNQVSVCTVDAVPLVRVVAFLSALAANEVQDFVFTFAWHERI